MTAEQALKILDDVTKGISATREVHQAILIALETLKAALKNGSN